MEFEIAMAGQLPVKSIERSKNRCPPNLKLGGIILLFNLNLRGGEELLFRGEIEEPIFCSEERSKNYFVQRGDRRTKIIGAIFFFCAVVGKKNGTRGEEGNKSAVIHRNCRDPVISNPTFHLF